MYVFVMLSHRCYIFMSEFSAGLAKPLIVIANQKDQLSASNVIFLVAVFLCLSNNRHRSYTFP